MPIMLRSTHRLEVARLQRRILALETQMGQLRGMLRIYPEEREREPMPISEAAARRRILGDQSRSVHTPVSRENTTTNISVVDVSGGGYIHTREPTSVRAEPTSGRIEPTSHETAGRIESSSYDTGGSIGDSGSSSSGSD